MSTVNSTCVDRRASRTSLDFASSAAHCSSSSSVGKSVGLVTRKIVMKLRPPDAHVLVGHDDQCACERIEVVRSEDAAQHIQRRRGLLIPQAHQDNAGVCSRRMSSDVAEPDIEGDEQPMLTHADREQSLVVDARHALIGDAVRLVTSLGEQRLRAYSHVFVEFDPHEPCDSGWISCFASQAP